MTDLDILEGAEKSENLQQVDDHRDHNDGIQDTFDFAVHGNVVVYQPEKDSDNDQHTDDVNERHEIALLIIFGEVTLSRQQSSAVTGGGNPTYFATKAKNRNSEQSCSVSRRGRV